MKLAINFLFVGALAMAIWAIVLYLQLPDKREGGWSRCDAPCIVHFPAGTWEDEVRFDFTSNGLHVWDNEVPHPVEAE